MPTNVKRSSEKIAGIKTHIFQTTSAYFSNPTQINEKKRVGLP
ncbi:MULTISPECIES: hypothetical protein [Neisseria]|nr:MULTISPECIES: hypothetical protein [Neisseria]